MPSTTSIKEIATLRRYAKNAAAHALWIGLSVLDIELVIMHHYGLI